MASIFFIRPLAPAAWNRVANATASLVAAALDGVATTPRFRRCFSGRMT
jgi:hypothetical protein